MDITDGSCSDRSAASSSPVIPAGFEWRCSQWISAFAAVGRCRSSWRSATSMIAMAQAPGDISSRRRAIEGNAVFIADQQIGIVFFRNKSVSRAVRPIAMKSPGFCVPGPVGSRPVLMQTIQSSARRQRTSNLRGVLISRNRPRQMIRKAGSIRSQHRPIRAFASPARERTILRDHPPRGGEIRKFRRVEG